MNYCARILTSIVFCLQMFNSICHADENTIHLPQEINQISSTNADAAEIRTTVETPEQYQSKSKNQVGVDLSQAHYFGETQNSNQSDNYSRLGLDITLSGNRGRFETRANLLGQADFAKDGETYYGAPEAYVTRKSENSSLTLGRQIREWSRLDDSFGLGLWQPLLRWDYLDPKPEGLTGLFYDRKLSQTLKFTAFGSYVFLPDQGPDFKLKNGQFESANRWFVEPQSDLLLSFVNASNAPLRFDLHRPSEREVIFRPSFAFGLGYRQDKTDAFWSQLNYAYKPQNQFHLGVDCANCVNIDSQGGLEIMAHVYPTVVQHHIITWENGFDTPDDQVWLSLTGDFPESSKLHDDLESPLWSRFIGGTAFEHNASDWFHTPLWIKFSYTQSENLHRQWSRGQFSDDEVTSSLDPYNFQKAAAAGMRWVLSQKGAQKLEFRNRYTYTFPDRGGWLSAHLYWQRRNLVWSLGMDVLGADTDTTKGLFARYRSNDRAYAGVGYVF